MFSSGPILNVVTHFRKWNVLSSEKRTLDHWATVQFFFSLAQVRFFWRCFCFRSGLVTLFLKMSERGDSWLQLQFTPCEALSSVWIGFAWQYSPAHPCCLCTFSFPISSFQSTFHLIYFDTALLEQHPPPPPPPPRPLSNDPLWLTLFVEGVNDRLLDHCQVSMFPMFPMRYENCHVKTVNIVKSNIISCFFLENMTWTFFCDRFCVIHLHIILYTNKTTGFFSTTSRFLFFFFYLWRLPYGI